MSIRLYNTLTRKKDNFIPIQEKKVSMYVCGVTVYDRCHIGHSRVYVVFDMIRRYFTHQGYDVNYVQNFTDIDDKIIKRANDQGIPFNELTQTNIQGYHDDMGALNIIPASSYVNATDHIREMVDMIQRLIEKGFAYVSEGDVLFSVDTFPNYGKLSRKVLDDLVAGSRVNVSDLKKNPLDFVLWKASKPGEPSWESPWGDGRPGWHIECSAMATSTLGDTIDIHGGGEDLIFPHHENEIAQSEACTGRPFSNYWVHNGFVTIKDEKMSKSLGNIVTIQDILKRYSGEVLRFYLLKVHYRHPLHFSWDGLKEAFVALEKLRQTIENFPDDRLDFSNDSDPVSIQLYELSEKFYDAMDDDFNSAEAIGVLFEISKVVNTTGRGGALLQMLTHILGIELKSEDAEDFPAVVLDMVAERERARENKDFVTSDRLRDELKDKHGILVEDTKDGQRIRRLREG